MRCPLLSLAVCLAAGLSTGCGSEPPPAEAAPLPHPDSTTPDPNFDTSSCGTITGLVTWVGPVPEVAPVLHAVPRAGGGGYDTKLVPLANAPRIDRFTRGVGGVVVFLREVDTTRAKAWDLPAVSVEFRDSQLVVRQGDTASRAGFVRRGDSVRFLSAEERFHTLRGRGAAFFSFAVPEPHAPREQKFDQCGRVELTCAAGCYWQSAHLFVCDHPYYAVTDAAGQFRFTQVPGGQYDLVAWHPSWNVEGTERNPETGLPARLIYAPPLESSRPVTVSPGRAALANLTLPR